MIRVKSKREAVVLMYNGGKSSLTVAGIAFHSGVSLRVVRKIIKDLKEL